MVAALHRRPDVAPGPILTGGISRGGVLATAFAGRHPDQVVGVLNFVGGWIGTGCGTAEEINGPLFRGGGLYRRPTLWIYGNGDDYYPPDHSRGELRNASRQEGGTGRFLVLDVPGGKGHAVADYRELWLNQSVLPRRYREGVTLVARAAGPVGPIGWPPPWSRSPRRWL